jgi:type VI secretion system protein VasJ
MSTPEVIASRAAPLLEPIAGAEPGGQNATYDPRYEAVRVELAKLDAPTGGEVEWSRVQTGCHELLTAVTKDFLLASQYAIAMMQIERWGGLAVGIAVLDGMLDKWWDTGFPPVARMRGRGNALDWLVARLEIAIPATGVRPDEAAMFETACALWNGLSERAKTRLGDLTPGMGAVTDALAKVRPAGSSAPPPPPPPAAEAPPPAPASDAPPPAATSDAPPAPAPTSDAPAADAPTEAPPPPAPEPPKPEPPPPPADPLAEYVAKAEQWLAPIPGANAAGSEARYEPPYEASRVEVAKLDSVTDNAVEWKTVHENASLLLRTKSKDLLMGAYLAFAKLKQGGIADFCVGLAVLCGLLEKYWDGLFPERLRGRAAALAWMVDQLDKALAEIQLQPKDRPVVLALQLAVTRTATLTRERMGHDGPSYAPVAERVQRMLLAVPEPKPAAPPPPPPKPAAPTPAPTAAAAPTPAAAATAAPANLDAVATFLQETGRNLVSTGNRIREASRASAAAYRLVRVGLYMHLDAPPPSEAGGKTQIPPLMPAKRQQLDLLDQNGKWEALIDEAEGALGTARFCIDLHRFTHKALERLGEAYAPAARVVVAELRALLTRMPGLLELVARDGTPLCDNDTKSWIAQTVLAGGGGPAVTTRASGGDGDDTKIFAEVRGLLTSGKAPDAMKMGQARIDAATTERQRFVRRLAFAGTLLEANQALLARGLFAALERELREHHLFAWEPELAARCLEGFVRAIRLAAKAGARYEDADLVYERLCLVDPGAAARLAT